MESFIFFLNHNGRLNSLTRLTAFQEHNDVGQQVLTCYKCMDVGDYFEVIYFAYFNIS